jgi:hypothetical protein
MLITIDGGKIYLQLPTQDKDEILQKLKHSFFQKKISRLNLLKQMESDWNDYSHGCNL